MTDKELIKQAKTDRESFGLLYDRYFSKIYNYFLTRTSSVEDAEDLTQECFIKILNSLEFFKPKSDLSVLAWFFAIARNLLVDYYRKTQRRKEIPFEKLKIKEVKETKFDHSIDLKMALLKLPPHYQEVIILKYTHEFSIKEIALIIKKNEGATKLLLHRAIKTLKDLYSKM